MHYLIRAFLAGVVIGVAVGWLRSSRTAQPALPGEWWHTFPATANTPAWTYTTKHPLR